MRNRSTPCPPGMCAFRADCQDTACPGNPGRLSPTELAVGQRALHTEDGGTWVTSGHRVLRLRPTEPAPLEEPRAGGLVSAISGALRRLFREHC